MARHRSHNIAFKRQVVHQCEAIERKSAPTSGFESVPDGARDVKGGIKGCDGMEDREPVGPTQS